MPVFWGCAQDDPAKAFELSQKPKEAKEGVEKAAPC